MKKIETLQDRIRKADATSMVISMLDEVPAYLTAVFLIFSLYQICLIPRK
jgi:hypothetical protein